MVINSLKELDQLMVMCRKRGIDKIKIDNIEFTIDNTPVATESKKVKAPAAINPFDPTQGLSTVAPDVATPHMLTEEQLLFYSSAANGEAG